MTKSRSKGYAIFRRNEAAGLLESGTGARPEAPLSVSRPGRGDPG